MKKQIRIAIAEDHDIVVDGLLALLEPYNEITVVFTAKDGKELLEKLETNKPDILLLDLEMPVMSGKEAFEIIREEYHDLKIIIISSNFRKPYVIEYIKKGVSAFLPKNIGIKDLIDHINAVYTTGKSYDEEVMGMIVSSLSEPRSNRDLLQFTEKELSVIKWICEDKSSKEIAEILSMNIRTVEWHRSSILNKLEAKSVSAIVKYAIKNKLFEL